MKLKKLDISGFKSFHEKASIVFPQGICAVVGPNGCGKSNVVDALRWVMGEQSMKQLRGKNREDIIFSGANGKPPLNMAEVSLTLINDNGSMPEEFNDFSEVMVTRRLYRSGETAYLINKRPCRLKDIHNIFMGSGVGAKTYAVIQQGNIGAITDAGPDERRLFIEEAAGVTRYKLRKTEAFRKIKATEQNLLRVTDIILEIARQMAGLKRQAKKAGRYKKLTEQAGQIDISLIIYHHNRYTQKIEAAKNLLQQLNDTDIDHTSKLKKVDAAIEEIKLNRFRKSQEISEQKALKFDTQRKIDRMEADLSHLKMDVKRLEQEIQELDLSRNDLEEKNHSIVAEISDMDQKKSGLYDGIEKIKANIQKEMDESKTIRDGLAALNTALENAKSELMNMVAEEARYKNIFQNASSNRETLQRRIKRIDEEVLLAQNNVRQAARHETAAQEELQQVKNDLRKIESQIASIQSNLDRASDTLGQQVKKVHILEIEKNKNRSSLSALKKMEQGLKWYEDGVRRIINAASKSTPDDPAELDIKIKGLMADVISPEPSFEAAVEAALGESLQYIIVNDAKESTSAIQYLKENRAGRCGFIPFDAVHAHFPSNGAQQKDDTLLLHHITIKEGFENAVYALLGHVKVVRDMKQAMDLPKEDKANQTIVTMDGDLITPKGIMMGGSKENLSGILAKKNEIRTLEKLDRDFDVKLTAAENIQKELEQQVRNLEIELQQHTVDRNHLSQDLMDAEKTAYKAGEDLKSASRNQEIVELEQEQLMGEELDLDEEIESYNLALEKIVAGVKEKQDKVTSTSTKISEAAAHLEQYNQKTVDLKLELTSADANLENCENTLKRLRDFQKDGLRRMDQVSKDLIQKTEKLKTSKQDIQGTTLSVKALYTKFEQLDKTLESSETNFTTIDSQLQENDTLVAKIRDEREKTLQKIRLMELELSENRIKRDNMENRSQERFHMNVAQLRYRHKEAIATDKTASKALEQDLEKIKTKILNIGDVNLGAIKEYEEQKERHDFLCEQKADLEKAVQGLQRVIRKINKITQTRFMDTFTQINEKLKVVFPKLFEGGSARLELTEPGNPLETGVEFMVHPPGKKLTRMSLLSGGEKALSAISFIFSIFLLRPASFCLMDEIDAPLDDANVMRFNNLMKVIGEKSQLIMVTHNKSSMEFADTLFGITMEHKGLSRVVSVDIQRNEPAEFSAAG